MTRLALIILIAFASQWPAVSQSQGTADKSNTPSYTGKPGTKKGDVCVNPKDGAEMVWVPAGQFKMGITPKQAAIVDSVAVLPRDPKALDAALSEIWIQTRIAAWASTPQRQVHLDGYWIYRHEVTVAQYKKFCKETGRGIPREPLWGWKDEHPIVNATWQDAEDYAKWATVSLPTEAQWEKAARGGDGRTYPWGFKWDTTKCANSLDSKLENPLPVGSLSAGSSPYGAMNMAGNVAEWCADRYSPHYYSEGPTKNPKGPSQRVDFAIVSPEYKDGKLEGVYKYPLLGDVFVIRGGAFDSPVTDFYLRCSSRSFAAAARANLGFRCAAAPSKR